MKKLVALSMWMLSAIVIAENTIDIYGDNSPKADEILKKYANEVYKLSDDVKNNYKKRAVDRCDKDPTTKKLLLEKKVLAEKIKREYGYLYTNIEIIYQHDVKQTFPIIEVITQKQPERLRFISKKKCKKIRKGDDVIDEMIYYDIIGEQAFFKNKNTMQDLNCNAFYCTWGFKGELKPYLDKFKNGAKNQKTLIINNLNNADAARRSAAVLLLGYFDNPKEIISLATPAILDSNREVRSNALSLISNLMMKTKIVDINILAVMELLNSPYDSDRNIALFILLNAAKNAKNAKLITQKAGNNLLANLYLHKQDDHELAYYVFRQLSGKQYSSNDMAAWKKWLHKAQQGVI